MRRPRWTAIAALVAASALTIAGCAPGEEPGGGQGGTDAEIIVNGTAPENPLVPGNTSEAGGGKVIDALFNGLITYTPDAEPQNAHAEKIDVSAEGKEMTFTLKKGWKFHDGTEIKADNYIKAWNHTAYSPNGFQLGSFFEQVEGFDDVFTVDPDGEEGPKKAPEPKAKEMSGLEKIDDYQFKATFTEPHPAFQNKLGYAAFMPLPDAFFEDPEAFGKKPIGSGPFKFVEQNPNSITIERYDDYQGADKPKVKTVVIEFGTPESAYDKLRDNNIDFLDNMPPKALVDNVWKEDLKGRSAGSGNLSIQLVGFPIYDKKFKNVKFRQAVSMAIDRAQITDKIYAGSREPVDGYGVPDLPLWTDGACGDLCKHNPTEAKKLFDESGYTGTIEITSNADGGHKEWIDAACGQIEAALKTDCKFVPVQDFGVIREKINAKQMSQIYRTGWGADYPHVENFLNPLYRTGGSSNDGGYSNPEVDKKLAEADAAVNEEEAGKLYHEAEEMIAKDMPVVPLWTNPYIGGWSERLDNVQVLKLTGQLDLTSVEVKADAS